MITYNDELVEYLTRYLAQCCFLLSEWDFYSIGSDSEFFNIKNKLILFIRKYIHISDYKYKFIYAYFASIIPNIFTYDPKDEYTIEIDAKRILKEIYENNKDNLIYKYFYLGTDSSNKSKRNIIVKKIIKEIDSIFPPKTYVEEYFNSLINNN